MKFSYFGQRLTLGQLNEDRRFSKSRESVIAYGPGLGSAQEGVAFPTENECLRWSRRHKLKDTFTKAYDDLAKLRREQGKNEEYLRERQLEKTARIEKDLRSLEKHTGLKYGSKALFLRATVGSGKLEGAVFDPAMLYTNAGFTGSALGAGIPLLNLAFFPGFDNTISSARLLGLCILFSGPFFSGQSRVLVGVPYMQINNLGLLGFNNVTSSIYV